MKWTLILIPGIFLIGTALGWTYHYSTRTMDWTTARQWCQTTYDDMVVIQNQRENDYLVSLLPTRSGAPYYWIGITKKHKNETWTWIGNNSTWIGEDSWAPNEPNNNHSTEFCVEIYVNRNTNRGKWNDEKCANRKYAVCYKAQCNATLCGRGRCQETIENTTCLCEPGFSGDRCQKAVECPRLSRPDNGGVSCTDESLVFNTTCQFSCEAGFLINGLSTVTCGISGDWSGKIPSCANYKQALWAALGCGAIAALCSICFCWMKRRKRKKLTQVSQFDESTIPSNDAYA
ncbi:unnamed protein product [Ophioblennius macclurei]